MEADLVQSLCEGMKSKDIKVYNVVDLIAACMELVEDNKELSGNEKFDTVAKALNMLVSYKYQELVDEQTIPSYVLDSLRVILESNLLQPTIDGLIDASKGRIRVNYNDARNAATKKHSLNLRNGWAHMFG
jgi:hypothetical protein